MEAGEVSVPLPPPPSGDPNQDWLGGPDHVVEHLDSDGSLALLSRQRAGAQPRANGGLVAADSGFRQAAATVAGGFLPSHCEAVLRRDMPRSGMKATLISDELHILRRRAD